MVSMNQGNAEDFESMRKTLGKPMIVELALRGGAIVSVRIYFC